MSSRRATTWRSATTTRKTKTSPPKTPFYPKLTETEIRNRLAQFRFIGEDVYKEVSVLSGGERARLTLCKLILSKMNLLVLDEPTNHLDIDSREALETALKDFDGTIIAVSHDRYFIEKLATRMIEITPGAGISGVTGEADFTDYHVDRPGEGYTEYRRFMENRRTGGISPSRMGAAVAESTTPSTAKEDYEKAKRSASDERKRQNRIKKLTAEAEALEQAIDDIDAEMNGEAATDFVRVAELDTLKTQKEERLMEVYEELEELQD